MSIAKKFSATALAAVIAAALALGGLSLAATPVAAFADGDATTPAATPAKTYTIKYQGVSGAKNTNPTSVEKGKLKLKKPTKTGYTFQGWYQKNKRVTTLNVKGNTTVTAKWKAKTYKITYKNVKGTNKNPSKFTYGKTVKLKKLSKSGYKFLGWYSDKQLTKKVKSVGGKTAKNVTLYGWWVKKPANAQQKWDIEETQRFMKAENAKAEELSQDLLSKYGLWIDPQGKKIGVSKKYLAECMKRSSWKSSSITFATANAGINWYEQAVMLANYCAGISVYGLSDSEVKSFAQSVMTEMGFTKSEVSYALKHMKI